MGNATSISPIRINHPSTVTPKPQYDFDGSPPTGFSNQQPANKIWIWERSQGTQFRT